VKRMEQMGCPQMEQMGWPPLEDHVVRCQAASARLMRELEEHAEARRPDARGAPGRRCFKLEANNDKQERGEEEGDEQEHSESFSLSVLAMSGDAHAIDGLTPLTTLGALRLRVAASLGWPRPLVAICLGAQELKTTSDARPLRTLDISESSVLTCIKRAEHVFGARRLALTSRRCASDEKPLAVVREEFGEQATVADFRDLKPLGHGALGQFLGRIGSYGGAFVFNHGSANWGDHRGGHFFLCPHSGSIPAHWVVAEMRGPMANGVDLCWRPGATMAALADLGPA